MNKALFLSVLFMALLFGCGVSVEYDKAENPVKGKRIKFKTEMTYIAISDVNTSVVEEKKYKLHLYRKNDAVDFYGKNGTLIPSDEIFIVVDSFTVNPTWFSNLFWSRYRQLVLEDGNKNKSIFPEALVKQNEWN